MIFAIKWGNVAKIGEINSLSSSFKLMSLMKTKTPKIMLKSKHPKCFLKQKQYLLMTSSSHLPYKSTSRLLSKIQNIFKIRHCMTYTHPVLKYSDSMVKKHTSIYSKNSITPQWKQASCYLLQTNQYIHSIWTNLDKMVQY